MSELNPVRIAVIGAGAMGRNHIRFVTEEPEAELVAIADAFEGARATAESAGVPFYTDPAQMMDEVKPEAVIIATPNDLHLGVAREAVKRNIVPLVEKPISNDLEDAQAFAAEAETAGVPVLVGQHRRHNPFVNKAKEIIESGELGKLTVSSFHYMIYKNDEYFDVEWRRKKGAGPILVNLVHDVDLLRYLLGEPVAVQGMQSSAARGFETEDSAVVNVRFADGALASMTISDATASPWNWEATAREDPQYRPFDADAYFIGGTKGGMEAVLDEVLGKNPNARICISAIALETLGAAIAALTARGLTAEVTQIAVSRTKPAGRLHLLMANNPIFLITGTRK